MAGLDKRKTLSDFFCVGNENICTKLIVKIYYLLPYVPSNPATHFTIALFSYILVGVY